MHEVITGLIAAVFVIGIIAAGSNGEWGSVMIGVVIVGVLLLAGCAWREEDRAYSNVVHYWARGGHERERRSGCYRSEGTRGKQNVTNVTVNVNVTGKDD